MLVSNVLAGVHLGLVGRGPCSPGDCFPTSASSPDISEERPRQLTCAINKPKPPTDTIRTETRPVRHEKNTASLLPHGTPVVRPAGTLESRHEGLTVNLHLGPGVLVCVDEADDLRHRPVAGRHVKRNKHDEAAHLLCGRVGIVQLGLGPVVVGADVQREAVDASLLSGRNLSGPLLLSLAIADADLPDVLDDACGENTSST